MQPSNIFDIWSKESGTINKEVAIDQRQVNIVNEFWNGKLFWKSFLDMHFWKTDLLKHVQVMSNVQDKVDHSLIKIHCRSVARQMGRNDWRWVEDGSVHDLHPLKTVAPISSYGNAERSG